MKPSDVTKILDRLIAGQNGDLTNKEYAELCSDAISIILKLSEFMGMNESIDVYMYALKGAICDR